MRVEIRVAVDQPLATKRADQPGETGLDQTMPAGAQVMGVLPGALGHERQTKGPRQARRIRKELLECSIYRGKAKRDPHSWRGSSKLRHQVQNDLGRGDIRLIGLDHLVAARERAKLAHQTAIYPGQGSETAARCGGEQRCADLVAAADFAPAGDRNHAMP